MTPWEILEIEADAAAEKSIKRAYAKQLKLHRPDRDPEGFRKVRDAYEQALNLLRYREDFVAVEYSDDVDAASGDREPPPTYSPSAVDEWPGRDGFEAKSTNSGEVSPEYQEACAELERILESAPTSAEKTNHQTKLRKAIEHLRTVSIETHPDGIAGWGSQLVAFSQRDSRVCWEIADQLQCQQLIRELGSDHNAATLLALETWLGEGEYDKLDEFAEECEIWQDELSNSAAGEAMGRLAGMMGIVDPQRATKLLDLSFSNLAPQVRVYTVGAAEEWISYGLLFGAQPKEQRMFWDRRLRNVWKGESDFDWWSEPAHTAVEWLVDRGPMTPQLLALLERVVPEDIYQALVANYENGLGDWQEELEPVGGLNPKYYSASSRYAGIDFNWSSLLWVALVVVFVIGGQCSSDKRRETKFTPLLEPAVLPDREPDFQKKEVPKTPNEQLNEMQEALELIKSLQEAREAGGANGEVTQPPAFEELSPELQRLLTPPDDQE